MGSTCRRRTKCGHDSERCRGVTGGEMFGRWTRSFSLHVPVLPTTSHMSKVSLHWAITSHKRSSRDRIAYVQVVSQSTSSNAIAAFDFAHFRQPVDVDAAEKVENKQICALTCCFLHHSRRRQHAHKQSYGMVILGPHCSDRPTTALYGIQVPFRGELARHRPLDCVMKGSRS